MIFFFYRWPQFKNVCPLNDSDFNWIKESIDCAQIKRKTMTILSDMSPKFYKRYELSESDLIEWKNLMKENPRAYYYIVDDLMKIVNDDSPINTIEVVPIK